MNWLCRFCIISDYIHFRSYASSFNKDAKARVELCLESDKESNKALFDHLYLEREAIKAEFGEALDTGPTTKRRALSPSSLAMPVSRTTTRLWWTYRTGWRKSSGIWIACWGRGWKVTLENLVSTLEPAASSAAKGRHRDCETYKKWRAYYDKEKKAKDKVRKASEDSRKAWNMLKLGGNIFIVTPLKILAALGAFPRR